MRKGIYAIVKPKEDGHVDINVLYGNSNGLYTVNEDINRKVLGSVTRNIRRMNFDQSKYHYVTINKVTYLTRIDDIATREEFIHTISVLARSSIASNVDLYAYNSGQIVYSTDENLKQKDPFLGSLNKAAMENIIKTETNKLK